MKKLIMLAAAAIIAAAFIGCGEEEKSTLKWSNQSSETVQNIVWTNSDGAEDQKWDGETADQVTTAEKEINALAGKGECQDGSGGPATIVIEAGEGIVTASSNSAVVKENADARLIITQVKKK
jgi:hypothetical protein